MNDRKTYLKNFIWRTLEYVGAKGIAILVNIFLARLLAPSEFGEVSIAMVILGLLEILIDGGLSNALIQKKDADDIDYSTVFFFNIVVCFLLYTILFLLAPLIASYYRIDHLSIVIRVQSLLLIITGIKTVQKAYVAKNMIFKKFFFSTLGGTIIAAIIGLWMAFNGYGVWALVFQSLINNLIDTIILWFTVKWRPIACFSLTRLKKMYSYGSKILFGTLIDKCYWSIRPLIIGKVYSTSDLAFFSRGATLPDVIEQTITTGMNDILFPAMSSVQDEQERIKAWVKKSILLHSYILTPMMFGLAAVSKQLITLLYSEKWLPAVPYLRIFCIMYLFSGIATANISATKAMGHSEITLKLNYVRAPLHILGLLITLNRGTVAVAIAAMVTTLIGELLCAWFSRKLINYPISRQIMDIAPNIILSTIMALLVWSVSLLPLNTILSLFVQIVVGIIFYIGASKLLKLDMYAYTLGLIKEILPNRRN